MSEELDLMGIIKQAILEGWGERCPDFDPTCRTCLAWQFFDRSFPRPSSAGEKWKLVPVEPTEAMLDAADANESFVPDDQERYAETYRAMLAAAPEPSAGEKVPREALNDIAAARPVWNGGVAPHKREYLEGFIDELQNIARNALSAAPEPSAGEKPGTEDMLRTRIAELEKALVPVASAAIGFSSNVADDHLVEIELGVCRRALALKSP